MLTAMMATIGPMKANIIPFSLGSQHLREINAGMQLIHTSYTVKLVRLIGPISKASRLDIFIVGMIVIK